jgi:mono/diheme cytochrome c family protein
MEVDMLSKSRFAFGLALLLSLVIAVPAFAGGWAVITLDDLPTNVVAGEPLTIGFTVLQHGMTPMNDLAPTVTVILRNEEKLAFRAEADHKPGHYTATLTLPKEGNWEWYIQAFSMDQRMPELTVAPAKAVTASEPAAKAESSSASLSPLLLLRGLALGVGLVGLLLAFQRKSRLAGMVAGLSLVIGFGTFMVGTATPVVEAQSVPVSELSAETSLSQVELGRQLFLAKGCITCHYNSRAASRTDYLTIETGAPDLSNYSSAPEILAIRLKDPAAAKSDTQMPNLELKETEIEALIAFINSK